MRKQFTAFWESLNSNAKSLIISVGAFVLAVVLLWAGKYLFPSTDFSTVEIALTTALSGFLVHLIKENIKQ